MKWLRSPPASVTGLTLAAVTAWTPTVATVGASSSDDEAFRLVRAPVVSEAPGGLLRVAVRFDRPLPRKRSGSPLLNVFVGTGGIGLANSVTFDKTRHCYAGLLVPFRKGAEVPRRGRKSTVRIEIFPTATDAPVVLTAKVAVRGDRPPSDDAFVDRGVPETLGCRGATDIR